MKCVCKRERKTEMGGWERLGHQGTSIYMLICKVDGISEIYARKERQSYVVRASNETYKKISFENYNSSSLTVEVMSLKIPVGENLVEKNRIGELKSASNHLKPVHFYVHYTKQKINSSLKIRSIMIHKKQVIICSLLLFLIYHLSHYRGSFPFLQLQQDICTAVGCFWSHSPRGPGSYQQYGQNATKEIIFKNLSLSHVFLEVHEGGTFPTQYLKFLPHSSAPLSYFVLLSLKFLWKTSMKVLILKPFYTHIQSTFLCLIVHHKSPKDKWNKTGPFLGIGGDAGWWECEELTRWSQNLF